MMWIQWQGTAHTVSRLCHVHLLMLRKPSRNMNRWHPLPSLNLSLASPAQAGLTQAMLTRLVASQNSF